MLKCTHFFQFDRVLDEHQQLLMACERETPAESDTHVHELLHFPDREMLIADPDSVFMRLLTKAAKHFIPLSYASITWNIICDLFELFTGERPRGFQTMRQRVLDRLPGCTLHYKLLHRRTRQVRYVEGVRFKKKAYPPSKYKLLVCETRANLKELLRYHAEELHTGEMSQELTEIVSQGQVPIPIHLYIDGVSPTSTGSWRMLCQVIRVAGCNHILNYSTFVYAKDHKITADDIMEGLLADLHRNPSVSVELLLCDMPERQRMCGLTNFNGEHGCLTCMSRGEKREGGPGMIWPTWTTAGQLRDDASFRTLSQAAQQIGCSVGGTKFYSPLLHIPNFSICESVAIDSMHLFSGISKFLWERLPQKFLSKKKTQEFSEKISEIYNDIVLPSDAKRETRSIDPPNFRANEWKQLVALCGLDIGDEWGRLGFEDARKIWHRYTYVLRMMAQGDNWYNHGSYHGKTVEAQVKLLYSDIERVLGKNACTPNIHALYHMPLWRKRHPLGEISTERAEAFYGRNRKSFAQQTTSVGKQIHVNTLLASLDGHACETRFRFKPKTKPGDMDHIMVDRKRQFWYLIETSNGDENFYLARQMYCSSHSTNDPVLNWGDCGIFKVLGMDKVAKRISKDSIIAKGILTKDSMVHVWTRDLQDF